VPINSIASGNDKDKIELDVDEEHSQQEDLALDSHRFDSLSPIGGWNYIVFLLPVTQFSDGRSSRFIMPKHRLRTFCAFCCIKNFSVIKV